jgi:hypothetical protein
VTFSAFDGLGWLLGFLLPFILVQRWLHRELQTILLLLTHRPALVVGLFSLIFLPGVVVHEASHWLMARLLRVKTGRFSVIPKVMRNGKIQMGFVETTQVDIVRDALIGIAPLISGGLLIAWLGIHPLGMLPLWDDLTRWDWPQLWLGISGLPDQPDFWLWFYLVFVISSMMLPSASDQHAWLPVILAVGALILLALVAGAGMWMIANLAPWVNRGMRASALVFAISLGFHLLLVIPLWGFRELLCRITGYRVR